MGKDWQPQHNHQPAGNCTPHCPAFKDPDFQGERSPMNWPSTYDNMPHSRSCGIVPHQHGPWCGKDCPTCKGQRWRLSEEANKPKPLDEVHTPEEIREALDELNFPTPTEMLGATIDSLRQIERIKREMPGTIDEVASLIHGLAMTAAVQLELYDKLRWRVEEKRDEVFNAGETLYDDLEEMLGSSENEMDTISMVEAAMRKYKEKAR